MKSGSSILSIAMIILFVLSGCGTKTEKSEELKAILNSSAASIQLTTGREVRRYEYDTGTGLLGKPTEAEVNVEYEPVTNHTKEEVFAEIIATLEREHWESKPSPFPPIPGYYRAYWSQQGSVSLVTSVSIFEEHNSVLISLKVDR